MGPTIFNLFANYDARTSPRQPEAVATEPQNVPVPTPTLGLSAEVAVFRSSRTCFMADRKTRPITELALTLDRGGGL